MGEPTTDTLDQRHGKPIDRRALALIAEFRAAEQRVRDNGVPAHHSLRRTRLIAAAVRRCCRCAFASPR